MAPGTRAARLCHPRRRVGVRGWRWGEQWYCLPQGKGLLSLGEQERDDAFREYGASHIPVATGMHLEVMRVCQASGIAIGDLKPQWHAQRLRVLVPCRGTQEYHWARDGLVVSLGQLFFILGASWTAAQIYAFYETLRIVILKRHKDACGAGQDRDDDQALPVMGSRVAGLAGTSITKGIWPS